MTMRMALRKRESSIARMGAMSRASLVHGTHNNSSEVWFDVDSFLFDQAKEVLLKLIDGSIDDEIWGKIVIMERCKRVAKAYLRKTTVIIDGSEDEFDGKTLGFNHFENLERDDHTSEIRTKIGDGVILKMDLQGNIKGMARGAAPVVCQGWRSDRNNCISDRLIRQQGRLNSGEEEKAYKIFDMKKFKYCLERELHDGIPDPKSLMLKTCIRVALVKDGTEMSRTPCWFTVVNLVALDMLREKIPNIRNILSREVSVPSGMTTISSNPNLSTPLTINTSSHMTSQGPTTITQETLTQLIAAAVSQVNNGRLQGLPVNPAEIAQLASSLNNGNECTTIGKNMKSTEISRRKHYHCSSSSLDSSGEDTKRTARRWESTPKMHDSYYDSGIDRSREKEKKRGGRSVTTSRPRLSDVVFTRSHSITSDYDSNREIFDSGSWSSSNSRGFKTRSTSSSLTSECELVATDEERQRSSEEERSYTKAPQHHTIDSRKSHTPVHQDQPVIASEVFQTDLPDVSLKTKTEILIGSPTPPPLPKSSVPIEETESIYEEAPTPVSIITPPAPPVDRLPPKLVSSSKDIKDYRKEDKDENKQVVASRETRPEGGKPKSLRTSTALPRPPAEIQQAVPQKQQLNERINDLQKSLFQRTQKCATSTVRLSDCTRASLSQRTIQRWDNARRSFSQHGGSCPDGLQPQSGYGKGPNPSPPTYNRKQQQLREQLQQLSGIQQQPHQPRSNQTKQQPQQPYWTSIFWPDSRSRTAQNQHQYCTLRGRSATSTSTTSLPHIQTTGTIRSGPVHQQYFTSNPHSSSHFQPQQRWDPRQLHGTIRHNRSRSISGRVGQTTQWSSPSHHPNSFIAMDGNRSIPAPIPTVPPPAAPPAAALPSAAAAAAATTTTSTVASAPAPPKPVASSITTVPIKSTTNPTSLPEKKHVIRLMVE